MNRFKKGLKDVGVDGILGVASVDSDDEEEKESGHEAAEGVESSSEFAKNDVERSPWKMFSWKSQTRRMIPPL
jgi:hypothetical protein